MTNLVLPFALHIGASQTLNGMNSDSELAVIEAAGGSLWVQTKPILLLAGAAMLLAGQLWLEPSFVAFILPMWLVAVGIVVTTAVTANGALQEFSDVAGTAVALHFCIQSLIVGVVGTVFVLVLDGDTAWPLIGYAAAMAIVTLAAIGGLARRGRTQAG